MLAMWTGGSFMMSLTHAPSHCAVGKTTTERQYRPDQIHYSEMFYIGNGWPISPKFDAKLLMFRRDFDAFCKQAFGPDAEVYSQFSGVQ